MIITEEKTISTKKQFEIIEITKSIEELISKNKIQKGIAVITTEHTTTSIRLNENEPKLLKDIEENLEKIIPEKENYHHNGNDNNAHSHLQALLMGASESIPIKNSKLVLGTWQKILFIELDGPRERKFTVSIISE